MSEQQPGASSDAGTPPPPWSREYGGQPLPPYGASPPELPPEPPPQPPPQLSPDQPSPPTQPFAPPSQSPDRGWPLPDQAGWYPGARAPQRRHPWRVPLAAVLILALIAGLTTLLIPDSGSKPTALPHGLLSGAAAAPTPVPNPTASPTPDPSTPAAPSTPGPVTGLIPTPPALLTIGYHAYSSRLLEPSDIALGPQELVQFTKYGLSQAVGVGALTLGAPADSSDDYDATINVLRFRDAAGAKAELAYSNTENAKQAPTVALPGLPDATGFFNKGDATTASSVGAFATAGRYQVVVIVRGLPTNGSATESALAAEAARVLRAVLPVAATIEPEESPGGTSPEVPGLPTPSPTGTRA